MRDTKVVKSARTAKLLLKEGYTVVDIAPHKHNKDKSVFIFKVEEGLAENINKIERKDNKNEQANQNQTRQSKLHCNS